MPKEVIHSRYYGQKVRSVDDEAVLTDIEPTEAHVGWTKDGDHVELGVLNRERGASHDESAGWFMQLDRHGINRLIRSLRKARDQAFGADA